jgi:hypothetical protein
VLTLAESSMFAFVRPISTLLYRPDEGGSVSVAAATGDADSGIDRVRFPGLGGGFAPTSVLDIPSPGPYSRTYTWSAGANLNGPASITAIDRAGNSSSAAVTIVPDSSPPVTSDDAASLGSGWKKTTQVIALTATDADGSGVAATHYTTDGSEPTTSSPQGTAVTLESDGIYRLRYFSIDNVSNLEEPTPLGEAATILVDRTPPSVAALQPVPMTIRQNHLLKADAEDVTSGVDFVTYLYCGGTTCTPSTEIGTSWNDGDYAVPWSAQPSDGSYRVLARVRDQAGNTRDSEPAAVTLDNTAPAAEFESTPDTLTNSSNASFSFASADTSAGFECRLDAAVEFSPCVSPKSFIVADGEHVFRIRPTDAAGNVGPVAQYTWTVDTISPPVSITAKPSDPTNNESATFEFLSEGGATFDCKLDAAAFDPCASPKVYAGPLADGIHTFSVRARDAAGNVGAATAYSWRIDVNGPETTILNAPPELTNARSATFRFSSADASAFQCKLDDAAEFTTCSSPADYGELAAGEHTFRVRATDSVGNVGPTASRSWRIDLTPPTVALTGTPADPTNQTSASFGFSSEPGAAFQCKLDGSSFGACTSPQPYSALGEGSHSFQLKATDAAGNTSDPLSFGWRIDLTPPENRLSVSVGANPAHQHFDAATDTLYYNPAVSGDFSVAATPTDPAGVGAVTFPEVTETGFTGPQRVATTPPYESSVYAFAPANTTPPPPLAVRAADSLGNEGTRLLSFGRDVVGPSGGSVDYPDGYDADGAVTIVTTTGGDGGAGVNASSGTIERRTASLASGGTIGTCRTYGSWTAIESGSDTVVSGRCAQYRYAVSDWVQNITLYETSKTVKVDLVAPTTTMNDPGTNLRASVPLTATATDTVSGVASVTFEFSPAGAGTWTAVGTDTSSPYSVSLDTTSVSDGLHDFRTVAVDYAGNSKTSAAVGNRRIDNLEPAGEITAPASGATVTGVVSVRSDSEDSGSGVLRVDFQLKPASGPYALLASDTSAPYSIDWASNTGAYPDGRYTLRAITTDSAGNAHTSAEVPVTVANSLNVGDAEKRVVVGPGFVTATARQVVRTAGGRVYVIAADDTAFELRTGDTVVRAYKGNRDGIPTAFSEVDAADRPVSQGASSSLIPGIDLRLDANGIVHAVFADMGFPRSLDYVTFSTVVDNWGSRETIASGTANVNSQARGRIEFALVLDNAEKPHVVYMVGDQVKYSNRVSGSWSAPVTIHSETMGSEPTHPSLAFDAGGNLHLVWLKDDAPAAVRYMRRLADGAWSPVETVASSDVQPNSVNNDQGPSLVVTGSGTVYVLYVSDLPGSSVRVRHDATAGWPLDPTPTNLNTHTPQIYGGGEDIYVFLGHDADINFGYIWHPFGQPWAPYTKLTTEEDDGSASVRWDPVRETNAGVIDTTFFDEDSLGDDSFIPEVYYMAVLPG